MATILTPTYSEPFSAPLPPPSTGEWEYWPFWTAASGFVVNNYPGLSLSGNTLSGTPEGCEKIFTLLGSGVLDATQVALTSTWAFALTPSGSVVRWAHGLAAPYENRGWWYKHWNVIPGLSNVAKISAGGNHLFYIKNDTSLGYWAPDGLNLHNISVPSWVGNETGFVEVATDQSISIARKSDGTVKAFAWDDFLLSIINYDLSSITNAISVTCNNYADGSVLTGAILTDSGDIYSVGGAGPSLWKNIPNAKKIVLSQHILHPATDGLLTLKNDGTVEFTIIQGDDSSSAWNLPADFSLSNFVNLTDIYGGGNEFSFLGKKSDGTIVSSLGSFNPGPTGNGGFTQVALSRNLSPLNWVGVKNGKVSTAQTDELQRHALQFIPPNDFLEIEIDGAPAAPVIVPNQVLKYSPGFISGGFYFKLESDLATDFGDKYCAKASSWSASGLPNWLTLNSANGVMTGTIPIEPGIYSFELTAINETGSDTKVVSFESVPNTPIITSGQTFTGNVGNAFSASVSLLGSQPATAWAATGIPSGLSINTSTGAITGTPTTKGSFTASVTATGSGGTSPAVSVSFTIAEGAPIITSGQTGSGKVGEAFSKTFSLTDSTNRPVTSWSATGLPSWASITSSSGQITGTPQDSGSTTITITATGPGGTDTETATISIAIGVPLITAGQTLNGKVGDAFSANIALDDALDRPATSWSVTGLPDGLSMTASTGAITGTPTAKGSFTASITATGSGGTSPATDVSFSISEGTPIIPPNQTGSGKVGEAFSKTFSLTDSANRPVTSWSATGLPTWASINSSTGQITGTPQDVETTTITLTATGPGGTDTETAKISIAVGAPIITSGQSFTGKVGNAFSGTISLTDAVDRPATSWSATGLPDGLSMTASTGAITGTPTAKGSFTASITATGSGGTSPATDVSFSISEGTPIIPPNQTGSGKVGEAFSKTFSLTDSTNRPVTSWSATGLLSWASINSSTGVITGTPQDVETTTITLTATGPGGSDTETATLSIAIGVPLITAGQTFTAKVGEPFSATLAIEDALDRPAISWTATGLPAGISINSSTGVISGMPSGLGSSTATITASNGAGNSAPTSVSFTISAGAPIITAGQTINGQVGSAISSSVGLTDSTNRPATSYLFAGLPSWAGTNSSTGLITGTPTAIGTTTISVTATGPGGTSTATTVAFVITSSGGGGGGGGTTTTRFMIAPTQTFTASLGVPFEATPVLLQGTAATWYAIGLPAWATIDPTTGKITGTPTFSGVTSFNLSAIDEENNYSSAQTTLAVTAWNVREIFVDVRDKKILSVANSRYPLSKITLKRDDKTPFRIIFVDGETPFSIPESFSVSVGLKKNFTDEEYLAFSPDITGTLDLSSEPIQELFLGGAESTTGFFEVKWEDRTSAFRTVKLAAEIQNSVIRGNDYTAAAYLGADAVTTAASTSAQVRAIGAPIFGPAKGNSYTIDISPGDKRISIAYPSALGDLASVRYNQFNNSEVLDTFTKTSVQFSTSGNTASLYFVYTYTASIPFEDFATYTVTL